MMNAAMDAPALVPITDEEFALIAKLVHDRFGIHLAEGKKSLVLGRLQFIVRDKGYPNFLAYYKAVLHDSTGRDLSDLADRISTNHTYFNREKEQFEIFQQKILPELTRSRRLEGDKNLRIWCAACSTGQEAYMLAMLMMDTVGPEYGTWNAGVLATDISDKVLKEAQAGVYSEEAAQSLPAHFRSRYFVKTHSGGYQAQPWLQREITFRRFNLMNAEFPFKAPFDVIFCRNAMIYFDNATRDALVQRMHRITSPGGYFIVGLTESLDRRTCPFQFVKPGIYRKI